MLRVLLSLLAIVAISVAWFRLVTVLAVRWAVRYAEPPSDIDTYFLVSSWPYRLLGYRSATPVCGMAIASRNPARCLTKR